MVMRAQMIFVILLLAFSMTAGRTEAQDGVEPGNAPKTFDLGAEAANPFGFLPSLALRNSADFGAPNGSAYFLNIQPLFPFQLGSWDVVNRPIIPVIDVSGFIEGTASIPQGTMGDGAFGLGDINYSAFFAPPDLGMFNWGFGPSVTFPTATDDQLGSGKWSAGPTAAFFIMPRPLTLSMVARQLWSFAGSSTRADVNQFLLQTTAAYGIGKGWAVVSDMIVTSNWDSPSGQRWTVPLGGGVNKFVRIGRRPMIFRLDAYYNVERPDGAPEWMMNFLIRFLWPQGVDTK
jgi:hypothetical protein